MSITAELTSLEHLRERGVLSEEEFALAKAKLLRSEHASQQNAAKDLRHGHRLPNRTLSTAVGLIAIVGGLSLLLTSDFRGGLLLGKLVGGLLMGSGVLRMLVGWRRADRHEKAVRRHHAKQAMAARQKG